MYLIGISNNSRCSNTKINKYQSRRKNKEHPPKVKHTTRTFHIPISLLAFAEAGYKTVHLLFPFFGSSEAKTFPVAARKNNLPKRLES